MGLTRSEASPFSLSQLRAQPKSNIPFSKVVGKHKVHKGSIEEYRDVPLCTHSRLLHYFCGMVMLLRILSLCELHANSPHWDTSESHSYQPREPIVDDRGQVDLYSAARASAIRNWQLYKVQLAGVGIQR